MASSNITEFCDLASKIANARSLQERKLDEYKLAKAQYEADLAEARNAQHVLQAAHAQPLTPEQEAAQKAQQERRRLHYEAVARRREAEERDAVRTANWNYVVSQIGRRYANCRLESFEVAASRETKAKQENMLAHAKDYCANMQKNVENGVNLVLFGPKGTGKDHIMAACSYVAATQHELQIESIDGLEFFSQARDLIESKERESTFLKRFVRPAILAISDPLKPSAEPLTDFQQQQLFRVIDTRYRQLKPIWVTLNSISREDLDRRLGATLADRLVHGALTLFFDWPSYRRSQ